MLAVRRLTPAFGWLMSALERLMSALGRLMSVLRQLMPALVAANVFLGWPMPTLGRLMPSQIPLYVIFSIQGESLCCLVEETLFASRASQNDKFKNPLFAFKEGRGRKNGARNRSSEKHISTCSTL